MRIFKYLFDRAYKIKKLLEDHFLGDLNLSKKVIILIDLAFSIIIYGCGITDFFQYQFYKRKHRERKDFIVHRKRMWLVKHLNDKNDRKIFDQKPVFNKLFNDYLGREWLDITTSSFDDFYKFTNKFNKFLVKPVSGSHGIGIRILEADKTNNLESLFKTLRAEQALAEELIIQNDQMAEFNPSSVNTVRVVTVIDNNLKTNIMTANLRMGCGDNYADNFHHDGIAALLDVNTGRVITHGIDKKLQSYIYHPTSGKKITGFQVPFWPSIIDTVKQASQVVPTVRYVGWDIIIGKRNNIMLVEGNAAADPDISQMPDQVGKWPLFRNVLTPGKR